MASRVAIWQRTLRQLRPTKVVPPENARALLEALYPTVRWQAVGFRRGLPWFIPAQAAGALVLPALTDRQKIYVYIRHYHPYRSDDLALLVHEAYHVLQYQQMGSGWGFGQPFLAHYIAGWLQYGYWRHPMEVAAYRQEADFRRAWAVFSTWQLPTLSAKELGDSFVHHYPALVKSKAVIGHYPVWIKMAGWLALLFSTFVLLPTQTILYGLNYGGRRLLLKIVRAQRSLKRL